MTSIDSDILTQYRGAQLLGPESSSSPLILCFHGSGENCSLWLPLAHLLSPSHRVLLYDRGSVRAGAAGARSAAVEMLAYLASSSALVPPYVLVAHSYGGAVARQFLEQRLDAVRGVVLVETGQETAMDPEVEERQYARTILGDRPLSVIRGNSLIGKWKDVEIREERGEEDPTQRALLESWDQEDERLKKRQLDLSRRCRYVHISDCGHHVVRDRPDVVAAEIEWVLKSLDETSGDVEEKQEKQEPDLDSLKGGGFREKLKDFMSAFRGRRRE